MVQHAAYETALERAGFEIIRLPFLAEDPDAVFVEDTAILLGDHAIITRPGAPSRRAEIDSTATGLEPWFAVHRLTDGNLDGGDILKVDRTLYAGRSNRTDAAGIGSLTEAVTPLGYDVVPVDLGRCLHLKTAVTLAGRDADGRPVLLANPSWVDPAIFGNVTVIEVAGEEPFAANVVLAGGTVIMAAGSPGTAARLRERGMLVEEVDVSELQKAEAGGTCMSLIDDR